MVKPWPLISSTPVSDMGLFKLNRDRSQSPRTGREQDFLVIHMPDWLSTVALTEDGRLVLVRQYRHASRRIGLEVPGGLLDPTDPEPAAAAMRELAEETGFGGGRIKPLGDYSPQPALLANRMHIFLAQGVSLLGEQDQDEGEDIEVVLIAPSQWEELAAAGEIHNATTVMALMLASKIGAI